MVSRPKEAQTPISQPEGRVQSPSHLLSIPKEDLTVYTKLLGCLIYLENLGVNVDPREPVK